MPWCKPPLPYNASLQLKQIIAHQGEIVENEELKSDVSLDKQSSSHEEEYWDYFSSEKWLEHHTHIDESSISTQVTDGHELTGIWLRAVNFIPPSGARRLVFRTFTALISELSILTTR